MNPSLLDGKKVVGKEGYILGEVDGIDIDLGTWRVNAFFVSLTNDAATELGFKRPFLSKVIIIIPSEIVSLIGNFINIDETIENLESLAECIQSCQKQN